jgi:hypothetical protein
MRWTLRRARRARLQADGEAVWSWHLDADAKSAGYPLMMVTNKPDHQGEHGGNRKTIAQGMPECFGQPVVNSLVCFHSSHTRPRVRPSTRHSLRPLTEGGSFQAKLAPSTRRDRETVSGRHCEEQSDEAIHSFLRHFWIASRSLFNACRGREGLMLRSPAHGLARHDEGACLLRLRTHDQVVTDHDNCDDDGERGQQIDLPGIVTARTDLPAHR